MLALPILQLYFMTSFMLSCLIVFPAPYRYQAAGGLAGPTETVRLLRSPANAAHLLESLARAMKGESEIMTVDELIAEVGIDELKVRGCFPPGVQ